MNNQKIIKYVKIICHILRYVILWAIVATFIGLSAAGGFAILYLITEDPAAPIWLKIYFAGMVVGAYVLIYQERRTNKKNIFIIYMTIVMVINFLVAYYFVKYPFFSLLKEILHNAFPFFPI